MGLEVTCRPAAAADEPFLRQLFERVRAHVFDGLPLDGQQKSGLIDLQFRAQAGHYAAAFPGALDSVLELAGKTIGRLTVCELSQEIRLVEIAVDPDYQNQGLGSAAIRRLMERAAATGKPVVLHVESSNPAKRLYERLGFQTTGEEGPYRVMSWRSERR